MANAPTIRCDAPLPTKQKCGAKMKFVGETWMDRRRKGFGFECLFCGCRRIVTTDFLEKRGL